MMTQEEATNHIEIIVRCLKRATPSGAIRAALQSAEALQAEIKHAQAPREEELPRQQKAQNITPQGFQKTGDVETSAPAKQDVRITKEAADVLKEEDEKLIEALKGPLKEGE